MRAALIVVLVFVGCLTAPSWLAALAFNVGYLALARNDPERAGAAFEYAGDTTARAAEARGVLALRLDDDSTASASFHQALARGRATALLHWRTARALEQVGETAAALEQDRAASDAYYFVNRARVRRHRQDWSGAEQAFLRAATLAPADAEIARMVGEFYWEWSKREPAIAQLKRAVEFETDAYELYLVRGQVAQLTGDWAAAAAQYQAALALDPTRPEVYRRLADTLDHQNRSEAAIQLLRRGILKARPAFGLMLRLGELLTAQGDYADAADVLHQARLADPRSDEAWLLSAKTNLGWGKVEDAQHDLQQALSLEPNNAETYYWLGRALTRRGECDQARAAYARAVTLAPDDARFQTANQCQ